MLLLFICIHEVVQIFFTAFFLQQLEMGLRGEEFEIWRRDTSKVCLFCVPQVFMTLRVCYVVPFIIHESIYIVMAPCFLRCANLHCIILISYNI